LAHWKVRKLAENGKTTNMDLLAVSAYAVLAAAISAFVEDTAILMLVVPLVLFGPGYALASCAWPMRARFGFASRIVLGFVLGIPLVAGITALALYLGLVHLAYAIVPLALLTLFLSTSALLLRSRQPAAKRFGVDPVSFFTGEGASGRMVFTAGVVLILLCSAFLLNYVVNEAGPGASYTELRVLGANGTASDYPDTLAVGENATVFVVVTCRESSATNYTLVAGQRLASIVYTVYDPAMPVELSPGVAYGYDFSLAPGEEFAWTFTFNYTTQGDHELAWVLYTEGVESNDVYLPIIVL